MPRPFIIPNPSLALMTITTVAALQGKLVCLVETFQWHCGCRILQFQGQPPLKVASTPTATNPKFTVDCADVMPRTGLLLRYLAKVLTLQLHSPL